MFSSVYMVPLFHASFPLVPILMSLVPILMSLIKQVALVVHPVQQRATDQ